MLAKWAMRKRRSSARGREAQKRRKQKGENFKSLPPNSTRVMENVFDIGPNCSQPVVDENRNLRKDNAIDIKSQRHLRQASRADPKVVRTYSRRPKETGHNGNNMAENFSSKNFQKHDSFNGNSSIVKSAGNGFWGKKNNDSSCGESSLTVDGKQDGSVREGSHVNPASKISTDNDSNKVEVLGSETNKDGRRRGRGKKKNKIFTPANQISVTEKEVSEKEVSESKESENIGSVKNIDLHTEIPSKSEMKKKNNIIQRMSALEQNNSLQRNFTSAAINENDLPHSLNYNLKTPVVKYTYSRKRKKSGQQGQGPHNSSYLSSQDNENGHCKRSLSMLGAAEAGCERMENNNATFSENLSHDFEKDGGCSMEYTCGKRHKKSRQQGCGPHNSSYLSSQDNDNGLSNRSLSMIGAAEAGYKRMENNNASFSENSLHDFEKDGGWAMKNMQTSPINLISSDINSSFHEVNRMQPEGNKKPRGRRGKKNKTLICSNPLPLSEKEASGSMTSENVDAVERNELDPEICSKSEMENVKPNSGKRCAQRRNSATKETITISKADSPDNTLSCDVILKPLEPKKEALRQLKCEISIEEKSNTKDVERCPHSVQDVIDDAKSDTTMKENITLDNIAMPLQRSPFNCGKKKLLILDLNGLLVDVTYEGHTFQRAPIKVSGKSVYKRPFCEEFLEFCFERFDVGVWSSRQKKNLDPVVNFLFGEKRSRLLFCWDVSKCTPTGFNTLENIHKPLVLKELKKLWNKEDEDLPWEKGDYSPSNTLLIDDSPYKALCNPPHTAIFPNPYDHRNENDYALGLEGDVRVYLEGLAMADDVLSYVKQNPFGQNAIMRGNPCWDFYLQIIRQMNTTFTSAAVDDGEGPWMLS